jgi:site-specific DNA-methyltransferase (cytosine-N4-specific)
MPNSLNNRKPKVAAQPKRTPKLSYETTMGRCYNSTVEDFLDSTIAKRDFKGKVNLIFTSPPFPLTSPKSYGNLAGQEYLDWIVDLVQRMVPLLTSDGSLVMEIGNAWDKGSPTMSTLPLRTLLAIEERTGLNLCQQFIWENSARLPGPATWVNKRRIRIKDSHTHVWWFSLTEFPKADNRNVLNEYSPAMKRLIKTKKYNSGVRPSEHVISDKYFQINNKGAIPGSTISIDEETSEVVSTITMGNTATDKNYREWCSAKGIKLHPARMPIKLAEFFIKFLTSEGDRVFDPFGGSNTTGRAAEDLKRKWIVVERDEVYVEGSRGRFE